MILGSSESMKMEFFHYFVNLCQVLWDIEDIVKSSYWAVIGVIDCKPKFGKT